ncbi:unnamed protein product [Urochloa decumbens]|uniref:F-box domain-containing protein n=1 Tax=Urochloa decumbens TaxID=240449 RepID=A0ABC9CX40_9POAL
MEAALGKRKRGSAAGDAPAAGDRLSALPDHLLHEIMSHMQARQMVQTCSLSRRWRRLWPNAPRLDIDQREFPITFATDHIYRNFDDFVHFLLAHVSIARLDAFRLHVHVGFASAGPIDNASAWIRRAIMSPSAAAAQEPAVAFRREGPSSGGHYYWRLKMLHLSNLRDLDESFAEHVRSRCPSLEELELIGCTCRFRAIASGSLRSLALVSCVGKGFSGIATPTLRSLVVCGGASDDTTSPFVVAAPALACLSLDVTPYNLAAAGVSFDEMASLARAWICLKECGTLVKIKKLRDHLFTLRSVSNATSLDLSGFNMTVEEAGEESMSSFPEFNNLRNLELSQCGLCDDLSRVSGHILRNSPNLEKLTLHLPPCLKVTIGEPLPYPEFKKMRALILHNYDPNDDFRTLERFLRSSPILEKLTLHCRKFSNDTTKKKRGTSKSKMNVVQDPMDVQRENLRHTEIIYKDDDIASQLVDFLLRFSRNLPNNNIRFTKVD